MEIVIRKARENDFIWVVDLMQNALEAYYGGDHKAHAKRIFDAHIAGGTDHLGFFSFEQNMFVGETDGKLAGMIHLVGKRQATYKISPLIVLKDFQGKFGFGSKLLDFAINYATEKHARQLYCTVAEQNIAASQFFLRKGFIKAGCSDSHYKFGITEAMFYKPLYEVNLLASLDRPHVSVLPFDESNKVMREQVRNLLITKLGNSFDGINDDWVQALFNGYSRRNTADINTKYKLIYVAINNIGEVIGVAGATPKKGSPIKIMPFIATNTVAFDALLIDIPHQLVSYGHKLYIHINPAVDEVISLQRLGWKLDAAMPSAYQYGVITQQWSLDIGESTMRTMRIKKRFYDLIKSGQKPLEVRVGYDTINRIKIGEHIRLITHNESYEIKVGDIRRYETFDQMLKSEKWSNIVPNATSNEEVFSLLKQIYPPSKEKLGVVALEFVKISQ